MLDGITARAKAQYTQYKREKAAAAHKKARKAGAAPAAS